jgi:ABC-type nickel/cobalt efflux system permease component RcnA
MFQYLLTGLAASMAHVISGPDHLAAVTPLSIEHRSRAWMIGFSWGIGHTVGMLVVGLIFILFKEYVRMDLISGYSDQLVRGILIAIGFWGFFRLYRDPGMICHVHPHIHSEPELYMHIHPHTHEGHTHRHEHDKPIRQSLLAALLVGIIHGLAGFSHLLAILPTLTLPSVSASVMYLTAFGTGTLLTMVSFTWILGRAAQKMSTARKAHLLKWFSISGCSLAILVGILWIIKPFIL